MSSVAVDAAGNMLVTDVQNHVVRRITPAGAVSVFAGSPGIAGGEDGSSSAARFTNPTAIAIDATGNVYVAQLFTIRKISPAGVVSTLAGLDQMPGAADGVGAAARFSLISCLTVDAAGNVYVGDSDAVRKVAPDGTVTTLAGSSNETGSIDGVGSAARFHTVTGLTADADGNLYAADSFNHTLRKITPAGLVTTLVGTSRFSSVVLGSNPLLNKPTGVAMLDSKRIAITSENTVLVFTLP